MPDFTGRRRVVLQPTEANVPIRFELPIATAEDANDGCIPYNDTMDSVTAKAYDAAGSDVSSQIIGTEVAGDDYVVVPLTYPATSGDGKYKITLEVTTTNGVSLEFDFDRVYATDL